MQLKNKEVVSAFFESYLYIRKDAWKLDISNPGKSHLKKIDADKLKFCGEVFNDIESAETVDAWVKLLHKLAEREAAELKEVKGSWTRPLDILGLVYDIPLLLETTRAARSYIIAQLKNDEEFTACKANIIAKLDTLVDAEKALINAKKKPDAAALVEKTKLLRELHDLEIVPLPEVAQVAGSVLTSDQNICTKYFEKFTKVRDSRSKKETSFADFEKNVLSNLKKLDEKIISSAKSTLISKPGLIAKATPDTKPAEKAMDKNVQSVEAKADLKESTASAVKPASTSSSSGWFAGFGFASAAPASVPAPVAAPATSPLVATGVETSKTEVASKSIVVTVDLTKTPPNSPSPLLVNSIVASKPASRTITRRKGRYVRVRDRQDVEQQDPVMSLMQN